MIKRLVVIFLSLSMLLVTSGCSTHIHPAIDLPFIYSGYQSGEVSIAVDYFGVKHIARTECPISGTYSCTLIYTRVRPGLPGFSETVQTWLNADGTSVHDVDIAVTDSGIAYIVYRLEYDVGTSEYWYIRCDTLTLTQVDSTYDVVGKPLVVARGNNVYIVYNALEGSYMYPRYKMLNIPSIYGWVTDTTIAFDYALRDAAVGWNGALYVIYYNYSNGNILYADNFGVTGNMTNHLTVTTSANEIPDMDVNGSPETVYIIYDQDGASDSLYLAHCPANPCTGFTTETLPLSASLHWGINGNPQVIADRGLDSTFGNFAYYVFTAENDSETINEVFEGYYKSGLGLSELFTITDTGYSERDAKACLMWSYIPVFSWREYISPSFYGDIYEQDAYPYLYSTTRLVRHTTTGTKDSDMACNADWGAGIWNEETGVGKQAWVSINTYANMMPIIRK